jgi:hypothetical protein
MRSVEERIAVSGPWEQGGGGLNGLPCDPSLKEERIAFPTGRVKQAA